MSGFYRITRMLTSLLLSVASLLFAGLEDENAIFPLSKGTKLGIGGLVSMECGQYINSFYQNGPMYLNRPWVLRTKGRLDLKAAVGDHLTIKLFPEVLLWYDTYPWLTMGNEAFKYPYEQHYNVTFAEAQGILNYPVLNAGKLEFAAGIFSYKYNNNAKNLGEYLFRTGARPAYICTSFDFAYARLTGFRLGGSFIDDRLTTDIMLTSETVVVPTRDWSISWLCNYSVNLFSLGGGIMFDRLFPVDHSLETPDVDKNMYYNENNEEKYMSFGGTKMVGQLSFDPKPLLPESIKKYFGNDDAKIYAEIAVLGTHSFSAYKHPEDPNTKELDTTIVVLDSSKNFYADIGHRIPVMFGFNIPTFKILDYFSIELEWYGWPYPNSTGDFRAFRNFLPRPADAAKDVSARTFTLDNWKYSLNFKKTVVQGFSVIGQLARDHTRHDYFYKGYLDISEALVQTDNIETFGDLFKPTAKWGAFGWWLKLQYNF